MSRIISSDEVDEAVETLVKADKIRKDAGLMSEVQPAFDQKIKDLEESKSLKGIWDAGKKRAYQNEDKERQDKMDKMDKITLGDSDGEDEKNDDSKDEKDSEKKDD